jgi:hypothetical protein
MKNYHKNKINVTAAVNNNTNTSKTEEKISWKDWLKAGAEFGIGVIVASEILDLGFKIAEKSGEKFGKFIRKVSDK